MNVQSLRLDLIAHRDKLRDLILGLRGFKIHLCCLQEMRSSRSETLVYCVEEYCFVVRGRVAVVCSPHQRSGAGPGTGGQAVAVQTC